MEPVQGYQKEELTCSEDKEGDVEGVVSRRLRKENNDACRG